MGLTQEDNYRWTWRAGRPGVEGRGDGIPGNGFVGHCMSMVTNMVHLPHGEETDPIVE